MEQQLDNNNSDDVEVVHHLHDESTTITELHDTSSLQVTVVVENNNNNNNNPISTDRRHDDDDDEQARVVLPHQQLVDVKEDRRRKRRLKEDNAAEEPQASPHNNNNNNDNDNGDYPYSGELVQQQHCLNNSNNLVVGIVSPVLPPTTFTATIADAKNAIRAQHYKSTSHETMTIQTDQNNNNNNNMRTKTTQQIPKMSDAVVSSQMSNILPTMSSFNAGAGAAAPHNSPMSIVQAKEAITAERRRQSTVGTTTATTSRSCDDPSLVDGVVVSAKGRTFPLWNSGTGDVDSTRRQHEPVHDDNSSRRIHNPEESDTAAAEFEPTLLTAHLVRPGDDDGRNDDDERIRVMRDARARFVAEAVTAEEIISDPLEDNKRYRKLVIVGYCCFLITILVISTSLSVRFTSSSQADLTSLHAPTSVTSPERPTSTPAVFGANGLRVFVTTTQLQSAVDSYSDMVQQRVSPEFSEVAVEYGFPIGSWDVSRLTDFHRIFDPDRTQLLDTSRTPRIPSYFDEDLSGWDVSNATSMVGMFAASTSFTGRGLETWSVSKVTDFSFMFAQAYNFTGDVSMWNTSSATWMDATFLGATMFNADLSLFNVSKVRSMASMFNNAHNFQGDDLRLWDVANVGNMESMFFMTPMFSGKVSTWNTHKVWTMASMFQYSAFEDDLSSWSLENVRDVRDMFYGAFKFTGGNLTGWNTSRVTDMTSVFYKAEWFNGNISSWDVSRVVSFSEMFSGCVVFDGDVSQWNTSSAEDMSQMFYVARRFPGNLSQWDTSKVTTMKSMFHLADSFNSDISAWNVSKLLNTESMFLNATAFHQNLCPWREQLSPSIRVVDDMFLGSGCAVTQDPNIPNLTLGPLCSLCPGYIQ